MKVRKAVITAAGRSQRTLPLQRLVDRDGADKSALQIILEEVLSAGVEEVAVVIGAGDGPAYKEAAGPHAGRLTFVEQTNPRGYGDAILRTSGFVGGDAFLHLVGDHLYVTRGEGRCAEQLVQAATANACAVSAVQPTRESLLAYYGAVGGRRVPQQARLYEVETVLEKPTPTQAEQTLIVPGLRAGHYLCYFGMHVLTPAVMELLEAQAAALGAGETMPLSGALAELAKRERYLALEIQGARYNIGVKYGILTAQLALAMAGKDREEVLAQLVELLAAKA
jgi:UTP--glucose-1-phosphate uridylyltransferase